MKRALVIIGVVLAIVVLPVVGVMVATFAPLAPLDADMDLPGGARLVKDGYVSIAVIPAGEGAVALIDCGNDPAGAPLLSELKRRGLPPEAVKAVLFTHGHPDHIAAAHLFKSAEVLALPGDIPVAEGTGRSKGPLPSRFDTPPEKRAKVTRPLADGETVTVGALSIKVYALPGHTAGSAAFLAGDVLYLGDSASAGKDGKLRSAPWVFSDDTAENQRSLKALASRLKAEGVTVKKLVFSHSAPLDGADALMTFE